MLVGLYKQQIRLDMFALLIDIFAKRCSIKIARFA